MLIFDSLLKHLQPFGQVYCYDRLGWSVNDVPFASRWFFVRTVAKAALSRVSSRPYKVVKVHSPGGVIGKWERPTGHSWFARLKFGLKSLVWSSFSRSGHAWWLRGAPRRCRVRVYRPAERLCTRQTAVLFCHSTTRPSPLSSLICDWAVTAQYAVSILEPSVRNAG